MGVSFSAVTLFPEIFSGWLKDGLVGQAFTRGDFRFETLNPRVFTTDVHHSVDDRVYGGSDGMAQSFSPWSRAIVELRNKRKNPWVVFLTPQGAPWTQSRARETHAQGKDLIFVCGRYAGFDERLVKSFADEEVSIGDYVLNGGELAAMVVMETVLRGEPRFLGHGASFYEDSFGVDGLLECPAFTRPQVLENSLEVPRFLLSGHHGEIEAMRKAISVVRTVRRRPDVIARLVAQHKISVSDVERAEQKVLELSVGERELLGVKK